ncbi:MAG TPA: hypothetical protein PKD53_21515 [Chloroflexaceae bacterium]|nr:hypothetical protein [Chloroflexaceae bacterium]
MEPPPAPMEPQPPAGDDPRLAPLVAYLEQHRRQVNVEALRKELLRSGHPPELVAEAVRRVVGAAPPRPPAWPLGALIGVANLLLLPFPFVGLIELIASSFPAANDNLLWLPVPLLVTAAIPGAQLAAGLRLRGGPRDRLGRALIWGAAIALVGMAVLALLFGICVAVIFVSFGP